MTRLPSRSRAHEEHRRGETWVELISYSHNNRYMFYYIEPIFQRHIRYKSIINLNPRNILTRRTGRGGRREAVPGLGLVGGERVPLTSPTCEPARCLSPPISDDVT